MIPREWTNQRFLGLADGRVLGVVATNESIAGWCDVAGYDAVSDEWAVVKRNAITCGDHVWLFRGDWKP